jgi:hypothetical protein
MVARSTSVSTTARWPTAKPVCAGAAAGALSAWLGEGALVAGALAAVGAAGAGAFLSCQASHNKSSEKEKTMKRISRWLSMRRDAFSWGRIPALFRLPERLAILPWPGGRHA